MIKKIAADFHHVCFFYLSKTCYCFVSPANMSASKQRLNSKGPLQTLHSPPGIVPTTLKVGLSSWIIHSVPCCFTKYHKCPGGSAATLIKAIRQLTGEYLQRTLGLSLDRAQEINNSPDRHNPQQIWAMGAESMKVGWVHLWPVHRFFLTEAIKLLRLVCILLAISHFSAGG